MASISPTFEKQMAKFLGELPTRARSVLKRRYGIGEADGMTLEAIGKREGITRERVRQIENDAVRRLKKSPLFAEFAAQEAAVISVLAGVGGIAAENDFLSLPDFRQVKDKNTLVLFCDLSDSIRRRKADDRLYARWHVSDAPVAGIEAALSAFARALREQGSTLPTEGAFAGLAVHLKKTGVAVSEKSPMLATYISLSKEIEKNAWDEYGHVSSPFVRPRGMRDSAFVALSRAKEPMHFRDIAKRIGEFSNKSVHVQTVHNELIKDARFVLVGRGLYALKEWGYEPGFVKDVLVQMLCDRAMTREEILDEVMRRRQVKASTIFINLQNKKLFKTLDDGTYTVVS
ncbi:MAG: sigma factor-like helix-turn-helix DNA-binding protein [Patescibacteria group bacterium]|mgnify:CR=1 FL=1